MMPLPRRLALTVVLLFCVHVSAAPADPLPSGVTVLPPSGIAGLSVGNAMGSTSDLVPTAGQSFDQALRVTLPTKPTVPWGVQAQLRTSGKVSKGDVLLLTFWTKADNPLDGSALIGAYFQATSGNFAKSCSVSVSPPGEWTRIDAPFTAIDSYAPGDAELTFHLGYTAQSIELAGVSLTDYGPAVNIADLPATKPTYIGREPDAAWRQTADANIDRYRKANVKIVVLDGTGAPIPGAAVDAKMLRHAFPFGTCVNYKYLTDPSTDGETYRTKLTSLFTIATPGNELKWSHWRTNRDDGIATVDWLADHGLEVRGHNLVWGSWKFQPKSFQNAYQTEVTSQGQDAASKWLSDTVNAHIVDETTALKGKCAEWDVVNEGIDNHLFKDIIGQDAVPNWFKLAHATDPGAALYINEDGSIYGQTYSGRVDSVVKEVADLVAAGTPISGVGLESHMNPWSLPSPDEVNATFAAFAKLHVPVTITEYDLKTSDKQIEADYTRDFLTLCFSNPEVDGFLMWGFWDGDHWLGDSPLFNKDWTLKPSGKAYIDLVFNKWWTNSSGPTDTTGRYSFRGFQGDYQVTVSYHNKTRSVMLHVGPGEAAETVTLT